MDEGYGGYYWQDKSLLARGLQTEEGGGRAVSQEPEQF
jgi:hypothetical protein